MLSLSKAWALYPRQLMTVLWAAQALKKSLISLKMDFL